MSLAFLVCEMESLSCNLVNGKAWLLVLHKSGQPPVRYEDAQHLCVWPSCARRLRVEVGLSAARRACLLAVPARYAEAVPVCAVSTPRYSQYTLSDLDFVLRLDLFDWFVVAFALEYPRSFPPLLSATRAPARYRTCSIARSTL